MSRKRSINATMERSRLVIWNACEDDIIRSRFALFGIDETRHLKNKTLYQEVSDLIQKNRQKHDAWRQASRVVNTTLHSARKKLSKVRELLKFWYNTNSSQAAELDLYNNKIRKYADFKAVGTRFYSSLLLLDEVVNKLIPLGYTRESVQSDLDELCSLDQLRNKREQESGDAQVAIKERNAKLDELEKCVSEMIRLARMAFKGEEAQYLEKLGLVIRS